jgi:predicted P-loop ATPase
MNLEEILGTLLPEQVIIVNSLKPEKQLAKAAQYKLANDKKRKTPTTTPPTDTEPTTTPEEKIKLKTLFTSKYGFWHEDLSIYYKDDNNWNVKITTNNIAIFIAHHPSTPIHSIVYDEFTNQMLTTCVVKTLSGVELLKDKPVSDHINLEVKRWLSVIFNAEIDTGKVAEALQMVSNINKIHSAKNYFNRLTWDGQPRVDTFLRDHFGAEDRELYSVAGRKWLCAAVKRVFEPGAKFDHMLVFKGLQGAGKSTRLKMLCPHEDWYSDEAGLDINDPQKVIETLFGKLIYEAGELSALRKKEAQEIKQFITQTKWKARAAYGRFAQEFKPTFVLAGSTNDGEFLADPTGNRRFIVVNCENINSDTDSVKAGFENIVKERDQLWAEAKHLVDHGEDLVVPFELIKESEINNEDFIVQYDVEPLISEYLRTVNDPYKIGVTPLSQYLQAMNARVYERERRHITGIMTKKGYQRKKIKRNNQALWYWVPDTKKVEELDAQIDATIDTSLNTLDWDVDLDALSDQPTPSTAPPNRLKKAETTTYISQMNAMARVDWA